MLIGGSGLHRRFFHFPDGNEHWKNQKILSWSLTFIHNIWSETTIFSDFFNAHFHRENGRTSILPHYCRYVKSAPPPNLPGIRVILHIFQFLLNLRNFREKPVSFSKNTLKVAQIDFMIIWITPKIKIFGNFEIYHFLPKIAFLAKIHWKTTGPYFRPDSNLLFTQTKTYELHNVVFMMRSESIELNEIHFAE